MFSCKKKKCGSGWKMFVFEVAQAKYGSAVEGFWLAQISPHINTHILPLDVLVLISKGFFSSSTPLYNNKIAYTQIIVQSLLYLGISISYRYLARLQLISFFLFFQVVYHSKQKKIIIAHNTNFQVPIILVTLKAPKWKYSRLVFSRTWRDPLKYFEISVLRHNRFSESRKIQIAQPNLTNEYESRLL